MTRSTHHRRSIRLRGFDYARQGAYFITICTQHRRAVLSEILEEGAVRLTPAGEIVRSEWLRTEGIRPRIAVDSFVIMPDHVHGILVITDVDDGRRGTQPRAPTTAPPHAPAAPPHAPAAPPHAPATPIPGMGDAGTTTERFGHPTPDSIPTILRSFKATTTKQINQLHGTFGAPLWQRGYYEHVIRSDAEMARVRAYILSNPDRWRSTRVAGAGRAGVPDSPP